MTADSGAPSDELLGESQAWVERTCAELGAAGRAVCGGWPGTVSEARRLVVHRLRSEPDSVRSEAFDASIVERMAHTLYAQARRLWLERALRNESCGDGVST